MIRKNLLRTALITTVVTTLLTATACGKKSVSNTADNTKPQAISAETKSVAAKELTKTELVKFNYTDADGNTYTLEGKAVANESGDATIEVSDNNGNKVTFTGKATTVDGKMTVSGITVKDAGILVKPDGTEIKVTTGTIVADAAKSDETTESDIVASEDVKQEVENNQKEEAVIEAAREEVTKAEESVKADDENNNDKNNDTIIADNGNNGGNENTGNNTEDNNTGDSENTGDSNNTPSPEPTPSEPEETPTTPSEPDTEPVETPTQKPQEELHPGQPGYDYSSHTPIGCNLIAMNGGDIPYDILVEYSKGELSAEQAEAKLLSSISKNSGINGEVDYEVGYWGNIEPVYILKCHFWVEEAVAGGSMQEAYYTDYTFGYPGFQQGEGVLNLDSMLAYHCAYVVLPITM